VANDHGKKESTDRVRVRSSKNSKKEEDLSEEEEGEETEGEDEDYEPESTSDCEETSQSSEGETEASSEEDCEESQVHVKKKKSLKRKAPTKTHRKDERKKKSKPSSKNEEVKHPAIKPDKSMKESKETKETKETHQRMDDQPTEQPAANSNTTPAKGKIFNDKNCDLDLFNSDPSNVIAQKVKVSSTLMVTCRNIDSSENARSAGMTYDYAALTIQRKLSKDDKMFEFCLPLHVAPAIKRAIDYIISKNPKYFNNHSPN